jgi:AmmeMemoRadiSam system radical SAM enzyme/AmmeMemoRadiSam system protein B/AmmeMemoRadiSam system protein A
MLRVVSLPPERECFGDGAKAGGWWHASSETDRIICDLCPRECHLKPGDRGFCFVRENRDGEMVLSTYGRSTGFCVDPIEKKPLNHFFPGTSVLSFGTAGCNLGCKFCQNWDISKSREIARLSDQASPEAIATAAANLGCRSVAFTYNDPVIWAEYAIDTARACRDRDIQTVAVTAGYVTPAAREPFFEVIDAANIDLKAFSEQFYQQLTLSHLQPVLETLCWLKNESGVWFEITNLIIPRANDSPDELRKMCDWILENLGDLVPVHFTAFHPDFRLQDRPATPRETLLVAKQIARQQGIKYAYVGNVQDREHGSTHCHHCGKLIIERDWYQLGAYRLKGGRCAYCNARIPGRFADAPGNWGRRRLPVRIDQYDSDGGSTTTKGNRAMATQAESKSTGRTATPLSVHKRPELGDQQRQQVHEAACFQVASAVYQSDAGEASAALAAMGDIPVMGAFVTLKRRGRLRGCCGVLGRSMPLKQALQQSANRTAREDVRMPPVSATELPFLDLDVSLLYGFCQLAARGTARKANVEIGRHGLQIRRGDAAGLLLPNVATEHRLSSEQFLEQVCRKAGLPPRAWIEDDTELLTFETCFIDGPFAAPVLSRFSRPVAMPLDDEQLWRLVEHCRRNIEAHRRGATPSYYLPDCLDGMVHGAALTVYRDGDRQPVHVAQVSLRPSIPLQATLLNLAEAAARLFSNRRSADTAAANRVGLTILSDPAMHGTVGDPDLRGATPDRRALIVQAHDTLTWQFNPQLDSDELLRQTAPAAPAAKSRGAAIYSAACQSTEDQILVSSGPRAEVDLSRRPSAVAGTFYPGSADQLATMVDDLTTNGGLPQDAWNAALIPHAGLIYSGRIAAKVLQRIRFPDSTIILCPKHTRHGATYAIAPHESWAIPGATLPSDVRLAQLLADKVAGWQLDATAHRSEHAIEVELPLLARLAPDTRIVGVAIGPADWDHCRQFAADLAAALRSLDTRPLLLISSDMNHFATDQENRRLDRLAIDALARMDAAALYETVRRESISMCGVLPAVIVLDTLRQLGQLNTCEEVAYGTSADVTDDTSRVVGYAGMLFR